MNNSTNSKATDDFLTQRWEERDRLQREFMVNPPPCGEIVEFRMIYAKYGLEGAIYWFAAADVQDMAVKMIAGGHQTVGLGGAVRWTSLRDRNITSPTPVPSIVLPMFNQITFALIEAGKGHVYCPLCNKTYDAGELVENCRGDRFGLDQIFSCPAQHELLYERVMHISPRDDAFDEAVASP